MQGESSFNALVRAMKQQVVDTNTGKVLRSLFMQGGSSFNALVRAMKQQVVDTNTGNRDPNLMFEINNLSMNKLQVFPDGELDVQARASAPNSAAFVRPSATARSATVQRPTTVIQQGATRNTGAVLHSNCRG